MSALLRAPNRRRAALRYSHLVVSSENLRYQTTEPGRCPPVILIGPPSRPRPYCVRTYASTDAVRTRVAKVNPRRRHHADAFEGRDVDRVKFDGRGLVNHAANAHSQIVMGMHALGVVDYLAAGLA